MLQKRVYLELFVKVNQQRSLDLVLKIMFGQMAFKTMFLSLRQLA